MSGGRLRIAVVFGGRSAEHEVSLQSAKNVIAALDPGKYECVLIGIDREGRWHLDGTSLRLLNAEDPRLISLNTEGSRVALTPDGALIARDSNAILERVDAIFPVLHGPYGEDGSIQGLAKLADLPCIGADILGSAVGMDKDVMKRLLREAGIGVAPFRCFDSPAEAASGYEEAAAELGSELFIKPANLGSSVGISHARTRDEYLAGLEEAFAYDTKVLVEKAIKGREMEVSVLGNRKLAASVPGEVIAHADFYSYEAKYLDENGAALLIPAPVPSEVAQGLRDIAVRACKALCIRGMARVDCFLEEGGTILVNEVNTIPGFTRISMYPKLWEASGLSYPELLDKLIELGIEDFTERRRLRCRP